MSAFLPEAATPAQRLLVGELREGVASRLLLVGIEGAEPDKLAALSRALAKRLQGRAEFVYVANGDAALAQADRDFLFAHRYVLSPGVAPGRFDRASLAAALERGYEALASPAGALVRRYLPADPTGEFLRVLGSLEGGERPPTHLGVWMSRDQRTALLLVQTAAPGFDLDAQEANLALIGEAFAAARDEVGAPGAVLQRSGPAVFAVLSRETIRGDVRRLSAIATVIVAGMLLLAFRSLAVLGLAFVPVATGALAGVAAVAIAFGTVHGITLGFGVVLIGEAIDYAIYFFAQRSPRGAAGGLVRAHLADPAPRPRRLRGELLRDAVLGLHGPRAARPLRRGRARRRGGSHALGAARHPGSRRGADAASRSSHASSRAGGRRSRRASPSSDS